MAGVGQVVGLNGDPVRGGGGGCGSLWLVRCRTIEAKGFVAWSRVRGTRDKVGQAMIRPVEHCKMVVERGQTG